MKKANWCPLIAWRMAPKDWTCRPRLTVATFVRGTRFRIVCMLAHTMRPTAIRQASFAGSASRKAQSGEVNCSLTILIVDGSLAQAQRCLWLPSHILFTPIFHYMDHPAAPFRELYSAQLDTA